MSNLDVLKIGINKNYRVYYLYKIIIKIQFFSIK